MVLAKSTNRHKGARHLTALGLFSLAVVFGVVLLGTSPAVALAGPSSSSPSLTASADTSASDVTVGSTQWFWAVDKSGRADSFFHLQAAARYVGAECVIYVDTSESLPQVLIDSLGAAFDNSIFRKVTAALGQGPVGDDGTAKVDILLYDFRDPSVEGLFRPVDLDPSSSTTPSNKRNIVYINSAAAQNGSEDLEALAAHEFAHLIAYYRHTVLNGSPSNGPEAAWVSEGIATYAEHLAGYDAQIRGYLWSFATDPNTNLTETPWPGYSPYYGASYAFISFLVGREGPNFLTQLVDQPLDGVAGINAVFRSLDPFDTFNSLFADWVVADFLGARPPVTQTWSIPDLIVGAQAKNAVGASPWVGSGSVTNYGTQYADFPASPRDALFRVVVDGEDGAPLAAALVSWDSQGLLWPSVTNVSLSRSTAGGSVQSPYGYDRHTLVVWALGAEGNDATYGFRYSVAVDPPGGVQFLDLGGDDPYHASVMELAAGRVVSGKEIPPGSGLWFFQGENPLFRAQFAKMIDGTLSLPVDESMTSPFRDLGPDDPTDLYPNNYVAAAYRAGIVKGTSPTTFSPYTSVSRAQAITMVVRAAQKLLPGVLADSPPGYQGSLGNFSADHAGNARIAEYNHLLDGLVGFGPGWDPWQPCSRDEAASLLARLIELNGGR